MSPTITFISGSYERAMIDLKPSVILAFQSNGGIFFGFSKTCHRLFPAISEMEHKTTYNTSLVGRYQYRVEGDQIFALGYLFVPRVTLRTRRVHCDGLETMLRSIKTAMVEHGSKSIILQYPGNNNCGVSAIVFQNRLREYFADTDITIYVTIPALVASHLVTGNAKVINYSSSSMEEYRNFRNEGAKDIARQARFPQPVLPSFMRRTNTMGKLTLSE